MRSPRSLSSEQVAKQVQVAINGLAEPEVEYGVGRSREIGMIFLEEALALRVDDSGVLRPANPRDGWLGDHQNWTVEKNTHPDKGPKNTSWLPGESTARLWAEIVSEPAIPNSP